jgi:hypothetical protein
MYSCYPGGFAWPSLDFPLRTLPGLAADFPALANLPKLFSDFQTVWPKPFPQTFFFPRFIPRFDRLPGGLRLQLYRMYSCIPIPFSGFASFCQTFPDLANFQKLFSDFQTVWPKPFP